MVNRRRGRDWIYTNAGSIIKQSDVAGAEIAVIDLITSGDVLRMTTVSLVRTIIQLGFLVDEDSFQGGYFWYLTVMNTADPGQGVYSQGLDPVNYLALDPKTNVLESRDPLWIEFFLMGDGTTFYGEPSDPMDLLRFDIKAKRSMDVGDRLSLVYGADPIVVGGTSTILVNSSCLVRAA